MVKPSARATIAALAIVATFPLTARAQLRTQVVATGLSQPLAFVQDPSLLNVFYIVQQSGRVRVLQDGILQPDDFANLTTLISCCGERGLLGMAFAPDAPVSGRVFFAYTNPSGDTVVSRFRRVTSPTPRVDPTSRLDLRWSTGLRSIPQPFANHNGGHLAFGPDGFLYVGKGDGGSGNDPQNHAQNPNSLLGKMLRIDVNVPDSDPNGMRVPADNPFLDGVPITAMPEIWAFGLRNPWRYSFDDFGSGATGALIIGDVGQGTREEISYEPRGAGGRNYGWRIREGNVPTPGVPTTTPAFTPLIEPIQAYGRSEGASVTGGFVYRGQELPLSFRSRYFYADFISSRVWSMGLSINQTTGEATRTNIIEHTSELGPLVNISSFGRDAAGELYLVTFGDAGVGEVRKIVPAGVTPGTISDIPNQSINEDAATPAINFTINDVDDPQSQWAVGASSSDTTLIPNGNLLLGGSGTSRSIVVTPAANRFGSATITVTFFSDSTRPAAFVSDTFVVTVNPINDPPAITAPSNQVVANGTTMLGPLPVAVSDIDTAATSLTVTAISSNQAVVANAGLVVGGSASNRTLSMTMAGAAGTTVIALTVSDGSAQSMASFSVTVSEPGAPPPPPPPPTVPAAPRNVIAEVIDGRTIALRWDPSADASGYRIEVGTSSGLDNVGVFTTGITTSFTIGNLSAGQYFVRVRATNDVGFSDPSNGVTVTLDGSPLGPRSPRNFSATVAGLTLQLRWDAPTDTAFLAGYVVEAGSAPGLANYARMVVTAQELNFQNVPRGTYHLRVRSISASGEGPPSSEVAVIVGASQAPCTAPTSPLGLVGQVLGTILNLSWGAPALGTAPMRYVIQAGSTTGASDIAAIPIDGGLTSVGGTAPNGTFFFRVIAINECGVSAASNEISLTVGGPPPPVPGPPTGVTGEVVGSRVTLSWAPPVSGGPVSSYVIAVRDTAGNALASFGTGNAASFLSQDNVPPGVYLVTVQGVNAGGVGPPSEAITVVVR